MKVPQQAAAIPFRRVNSALELCLIQRKGDTAWGIPKGTVDPGDTHEETALNEAWEEAGLIGRVVGQAVGTYEYEKWDRILTVAVFLMEVVAEEETWQEASFRRRRWLSYSEAASRLTDHPVWVLLARATAGLRSE